MRFAKREARPIFPFLIGTADVPFGFGDLSYSEAQGWEGEETHIGYQQLKAKMLRPLARDVNRVELIVHMKWLSETNA